MKHIIYLLGILIMAQSCAADQQKDTGASESMAQAVSNELEVREDGLGKIWYQGKAEVNRFELMQNRYRQVHPGELVLIFVTEDFLTKKQVKNDNYQNPNSTPIIKTNQLRKFTTGFYDYSVMLSVFTPTKVNEFPRTMKITNTSQDWCGHTFMQVNDREDGLEMELRSYFENEGDKTAMLESAFLEDEIFNRIRMNPGSLPMGEVEMYTSTTYARLAHKPFEPIKAEASLEDYKGSEFTGENLKIYEVYYPSHRRTLSVIFSGNAPYQIEGFKEAAPSVFDGTVRETVARRTHTEWIDYWSKNSLGDASLRDKIGMEASYE